MCTASVSPSLPSGSAWRAHFAHEKLSRWFKKIEDVPLEVVGQAIKRMPLKQHLASYEAMLEGREAGKTKKKR